MEFKTKIVCVILPIYLLYVFDELLFTQAYMKSVRIEEIPFALSMKVLNKTHESTPLRPPVVAKESAGIYATKRLDQHKSFLKIFNIPCKYIQFG